MAVTTWLVPMLAAVVAASALHPSLAAASDQGFSHIRTTDSRLRTLVQGGARYSPTLRALLERIEQSDVVVYLRCDVDLAPGSEGRLTFVASAAGYRYVLIRLRQRPSGDHQLAIIGHELQHAVEVAETPAIVDNESMEREYRKIGYTNPFAAIRRGGVAFDTDRAIEAGNRVLRELVDSSAEY